MKNMLKLYLSVLIFLLCTVAYCEENDATTQQSIGEYSILIKSKRSSSRSDICVDFDISVYLKIGDGFAYIPIPTYHSEDLNVVVEPSSSNNLVLYGLLRPAENFAVCAIKRSKKSSSKIRVILKDVLIPVGPSGRSDSEIALKILLKEAYDVYQKEGLPIENIPTLSDVIIVFENFKESWPSSSSSDRYDRRVITRRDLSEMAKDITIYLSKNQSETFLYWVLGVMGVLIGYFGAPKVVTSPSRVKIFTIVGVIILVSMVAFFFGYLTKQQRATDTTTIVTFGSTFGLVIGILFSSIQTLVQTRSSAGGRGPS